MSYGEEQKKEIETIREKNIVVKLSEVDCERVSELCGEHGLTVGQLVENFIGDLVSGTYTNGSDERSMARAYFERCWFGMFPKETLLNYFLYMGFDVAELLNVLDNIETAKEEIEYSKENPEEYDEEELSFLEDDLNYWNKEFHRYVDDYMKKHPDVDFDKEMEAIKKWHEEKERFKNE